MEQKLGEIDRRLVGDGWTVIADVGGGVPFCEGTPGANEGKWKIDANGAVKEFRSELRALKWAEKLRSGELK